MNKFLLLFLIVLSPVTFAQQCQVRVENELHHYDDSLDIVLDNGHTATIDKDNRLFIDKKEQALSPEQQVVLANYRQQVSAGVQQYQQIAAGYLQQIDAVIDELSHSLGDAESLESLRAKVHAYWNKTSEQHTQHDQFVVGADIFTQLDEVWEKMQSFFDKEAMSDLWATFSAGVGKLSDLSFSEFADLIQDLNQRIYQHWQQFSDQKESQQQEMCDSFNQLIDQEKSLHESIPELKNYQVFTI